jgi:hypothetical protein
MTENDRELFKPIIGQENITYQQLNVVSELHAKYFNHSKQVPCSCNKKQINKWIKHLTDLYEQVG